MEPIGLTLKGIVAMITAAALEIFGAWDVATQALLVIVCLDILSGLLRAAKQRRLDSSEMTDGLIKKVLIVVAVGLAHQVGCITDIHILRTGVVLWFCGSEGLSVVENMAAAGLPVPDVLRNALIQLRRDKMIPSDE